MNCIKTRLERDDDLSDISPWSERNFTCSFCRREFRSAQALGGHMNVHRRDRARLRLLPPNTILPSSSSEFSPYPNPKFLSSSLSTYMSTPSSGSSDKKATKQLDGAFLNTKRGSSTARDYDMIRGFAYKHHRGDDFNKVVKKEEKHMSKVRVDHVNMSLQLVQDPNKEEVDLELRLGHL